MFSQGELYFTMSNNDGEVDNKVTEGTLPAFARSYVLDAGTLFKMNKDKSLTKIAEGMEGGTDGIENVMK